MDQNIGKDTEKLLEQYEQQSNSVGKHAYSENLHNDTGCGCCDICDICVTCSTC